MIGTSVDTRAFSEIAPDERFRAEPPHNSSLLINDAMNIVRSETGTNVQAAESESAGELPSVEQTLDEMISRCRNATQKYPASPRTHMNLGLALMRRGHTSEGIQELQLAVSLDANDYVASGSLAAAYFNSGDLETAEKLYGQMTFNFANNVAGYMGLASIALKRNDLQEASSFLERALEIDSNLANASFLLAIVHFKLNKPQRAISVLRKALRDNARSPELNQGLAIAYLLAGEIHRAERSFRTALLLNPTLTSALHGLGLLWLQQKRPDEVIEMFSKHLESHPEDLEGREMLAQALVSKGQFRQARNHFGAILSKLTALPVQNKNEIAKVENNLGFCFAREGLYKEAESKILESINKAPRLAPEAFENLARIYFLQGRIDRALSSIETSFSQGLKSSSLVLLKEVCLVNLGRYEDAITEMLRLIGEKDAPMEAYAELGWLFCEWREDYATAITILKAGLDKWSDNTLILNNLAYAHIMNGELAAAHALLEVARDDEKGIVCLTATRGLLALYEGHVEKGETLYREAEDIASQAGNRDLMFAVRQKKCLEIARVYVSAGNFAMAMKFIEQGRLINLAEKRFPFGKQLALLREKVNLMLPSGEESSE